MSWGHLHLLLNHVPVIGTLLGLLLLLVGVWQKERRAQEGDVRLIRPYCACNCSRISDR
jgi:hypothetical protein